MFRRAMVGLARNRAVLVPAVAKHLRPAAAATSPAAAATATTGFRGVRCVSTKNPHLEQMDMDFLYHLGLSSGDTAPDGREKLEELFGDVKFFCCGGSAGRMTQFAHDVAQHFEGTEHELPFGAAPVPLGKQDRYSFFKVGPVLISSHGMGQPSVSILLHEIAKLLEHAKAKDVTFLRLGSSGGVGVEPGTVVVSTGGVNGMVEPVYSLPVLGKMEHLPAIINPEVVEEILSATGAQAANLGFPVVPGKTMSADCFYEGQGRLDGAICDYQESDKMDFLNRLHEYGVRNIEMEAAQFASFTHRLNIRSCIMCVTLLNRLDGDQVLSPVETLMEYDLRPGKAAIAYMNAQLGL